jgi:hypothetical protein
MFPWGIMTVVLRTVFVKGPNERHSKPPASARFGIYDGAWAKERTMPPNHPRTPRHQAVRRMARSQHFHGTATIWARTPMPGNAAEQGERLNEKSQQQA